MNKVIKSVFAVFSVSSLALSSLYVSANVTLDNVTDYYMYGTLIETEFDIDNHVSEQISDVSETVLATESMMLAGVEHEQAEVAQVSAE